VSLVRAGISLLLAVFVVACDSGNDNGLPETTNTASPSENDATIVPVTAAGKPATVPEDATAVTETQALGQISRSGGTPEGVQTRQIEELTCDGDVMTMQTDQETIYSAIPCDSVPQGGQLEPFLEKDAAIELEVGADRSRILIETIDGSQAEFTVGGIWVEQG
jgi:hypothetical protein